MRPPSFLVFAGTVVVIVWAIVVLTAVVRNEYTPDAGLASIVLLVLGGWLGASGRQKIRDVLADNPKEEESP